MKVKKILAMAISMVMCAAMFAGCGDAGSGSDDGGKSTKSGSKDNLWNISHAGLIK